MPEAKSQLVIAKRLFSRWRSNRKSRNDAIPQNLFLAAARAARESGFSRAMRELNIAGSFLTKAKLLLEHEEKQHKVASEKSKFKITKVVPVSMSQDFLVTAEIEFSHGAKIKIYEKGLGLIEVLRASICEFNARPQC